MGYAPTFLLFVLSGDHALWRGVHLSGDSTGQCQMQIGTTALLTGVATTLLATTTSSEALFLTGTAIAGVGFGGGFQGAIRTIAPLAAPHERAGVLSIIYLALVAQRSHQQRLCATRFGAQIGERSLPVRGRYLRRRADRARERWRRKLLVANLLQPSVVIAPSPPRG